MTIVFLMQLLVLVLSVTHCFFSRLKNAILAFSALNAIVSLYVFFVHLNNPHSHYSCFMSLLFGCNLGISSNSLSIVLGTIVIVISSVISCFAYGFMRKKLEHFLCYLNALTLFVLVFVCSDNLFQAYIFYGLSSITAYFFIHFDNNTLIKHNDYCVPNLIGNALILAALIAIKYNFNTLRFEDISNIIISSDIMLTRSEIITCLITFGLLIKSSQFLASRWIKTTMLAPLPSTILIQTMIAMNIFVIIWLQNLLDYSVISQTLLILFGIATSVWCAIKAMHAKSLNSMLAYSTNSQIGLMFMACGFSSYSSVIIIFATYSFSKLLLFLSVGSVQYSLSGENKIENMGGLFELLPKTYVAFIIAAISLINIPLLPSYYAKKQLIMEIVSSSSPMCYSAMFAMIISSIFLCICLFRMIYFIFHGHSHVDEVALAYVNEKNHYINIALYVSMFFALFSGVIFYYFVLTDVVWKEVFAFIYSSSTSSVWAFTIINIVGIVGSLFIYKGIKYKSFDFKYKIDIIQLSDIYAFIEKISLRRLFVFNQKFSFYIDNKIFFLLFLMLLFLKVLRAV